MEVQTRNGRGETPHWPSIRDAYEAYQRDNTIWKISWNEGKQRLRYVPKTKMVPWQPASEKKLEEIVPGYKDAGAGQLFWINQDILPENSDEIMKKYVKKLITKKQKDEEWLLGCIQGGMSDQAFRDKYVN